MSGEKKKVEWKTAGWLSLAGSFVASFAPVITISILHVHLETEIDARRTDLSGCERLEKCVSKIYTSSRQTHIRCSHCGTQYDVSSALSRKKKTTIKIKQRTVDNLRAAVAIFLESRTFGAVVSIRNACLPHDRVSNALKSLQKKEADLPGEPQMMHRPPYVPSDHGIAGRLVRVCGAPRIYHHRLTEVAFVAHSHYSFWSHIGVAYWAVRIQRKSISAVPLNSSPTIAGLTICRHTSCGQNLK